MFNVRLKYVIKVYLLEFSMILRCLRVVIIYLLYFLYEEDDVEWSRVKIISKDFRYECWDEYVLLI